MTNKPRFIIKSVGRYELEQYVSFDDQRSPIEVELEDYRLVSAFGYVTSFGYDTSSYITFECLFEHKDYAKNKISEVPVDR